MLIHAGRTQAGGQRNGAGHKQYRWRQRRRRASGAAVEAELKRAVRRHSHEQSVERVGGGSPAGQREGVVLRVREHAAWGFEPQLRVAVGTAAAENLVEGTGARRRPVVRAPVVLHHHGEGVGGARAQRKAEVRGQVHLLLAGEHHGGSGEVRLAARRS